MRKTDNRSFTSMNLDILFNTHSERKVPKRKATMNFCRHGEFFVSIRQRQQQYNITHSSGTVDNNQVAIATTEMQRCYSYVIVAVCLRCIHRDDRSSSWLSVWVFPLKTNTSKYFHLLFQFFYVHNFQQKIHS